jgi:hypothetical protein
MVARERCRSIHELVLRLMPYRNPAEVPFDDGLYFFFEHGETSPHAPAGRIVRVGNHPRSAAGLKRRLQNHYSGGKNGSVFRKFLGGALMRRAKEDHPCLQPGPGQGHWEKQDAPTCDLCRPYERRVSELLRECFSFRTLWVPDRSERNDLEQRLIATLSLCDVCRPSDLWLGRFAYSDAVRRSGLWNAQYVFDASRVISPGGLERLERLVERSLALGG